MTYTQKISPAALFLAELDDVQQMHCDFFRFGEVFVTSTDAERIEEDCHVHLETLSAVNPGQGWGRQAMNILCALADIHGVSIHMVAKASKKLPGLNQKDLEAFYCSLGFSVVTQAESYAMMSRRPRVLELDEAISLERLVLDGPDWQPPGALPSPC